MTRCVPVSGPAIRRQQRRALHATGSFVFTLYIGAFVWTPGALGTATVTRSGLVRVCAALRYARRGCRFASAAARGNRSPSLQIQARTHGTGV